MLLHLFTAPWNPAFQVHRQMHPRAVSTFSESDELLGCKQPRYSSTMRFSQSNLSTMSERTRVCMCVWVCVCGEGRGEYMHGHNNTLTLILLIVFDNLKARTEVWPSVQHIKIYYYTYIWMDLYLWFSSVHRLSHVSMFFVFVFGLNLFFDISPGWQQTMGAY